VKFFAGTIFFGIIGTLTWDWSNEVGGIALFIAFLFFVAVLSVKKGEDSHS
jgi:hypothetical protein